MHGGCFPKSMIFTGFIIHQKFDGYVVCGTSGMIYTSTCRNHSMIQMENWTKKAELWNRE